MAWTLQQSFGSVAYLVFDTPVFGVTVSRGDAVIKSAHVFGVVLLTSSEGVAHIRFQSVYAPVRREAVFESGFGVELSGDVVTENDGRKPGGSSRLIDES